MKKVQDLISRPIGSREIHKTKAETVLPDTLYSVKLKINNSTRILTFGAEIMFLAILEAQVSQ